MTDFYINVFQKGDYILVNEYKNGVRKYNKYKFKPSLYFRNNTKNFDSKYKTIDGITLVKKTYDSINDCYKDLEQLRGISNFCAYGTNSYKMQWINENYHHDIEYDPNLVRNVFIDIENCCELGFPEPSIAPEPINAITYYDSIDKKYYVLTNKDYGRVSINDEECELIECENEKDLLWKFLTLWTTNYPDNYLGWNSSRYDIPYIINRLKKNFDEEIIKKLSPFGIVKTKTVQNQSGKDEIYYNIVGVNDLDYMELYKKYTFGEKPSYSLKYITTLELGETKLEHEEFANMHLFYKENYQKFIEYNIQDVKLLIKLDKHLKFINLIMQIAYLAKINFRECYSPVITWESLIYNHEENKGIFFEIKDLDANDGAYTGAFVKQPVPSKYKWVVSFDLNSLYPSLIRQFNISPEKLLSDYERNEILYKIKDENNETYKQLIDMDNVMDNIINHNIDTNCLKNFDVSLTGSGYMFKRDNKGFMPEIMEHIYNQRRQVKKQMLINESNAEKLKAEIHRRGLTIENN